MAKKLSNAKIEYIRQNYGKQTLHEIADRLDIAHETVRHYALKLGLRETRKQNQEPYRQIAYPSYTPGQIIPVHVRELNRDKVTRRNATVSEVYPCFVLLLIPSQYGDISTRTCIDYYDLATNRTVVI